MSRQRVNRILSECIDLGIVEIRINSDDSKYLELETQLERYYGLKTVRVVGGVTPDNLYSEIGLHAGSYLSEVIHDGDVIGFSRGRTLSGVVSQLPPISHKNLVAVQLIGGWNDRQNTVGGDDIVHRFSERVPVTDTVILYAPVLLQDKKLRDIIVREPFFSRAYKVIQSCTVAMLGIGWVGRGALLPTIYEEDFNSSLPEEVVGEVCAHFYNIDGKPVSSKFDDRIISINYKDLMNVPLRIGVSGLPAKLPAVLGAVRGGYINVLITDAETALLMYKEALAKDKK
jgi:DNA-binding transcriptional regulator LsrR (DeoR family)